MPRQPRVHVPGGSYHVTLRGNHQHAIFARLLDRDRLDDIVAEAMDRHGAMLDAYCWMSNHLHALVQVSETPLAQLMQRIASRYARYFQGSFGITGHLFERRYHALLVDRDNYLLELVRYIHLNPVRAGIVGHAAEYHWSSHTTYLGAAVRPWVRSDRILAMFGSDPATARAAYGRFVQAGEAAGLSFPASVGRIGGGRLLPVPLASTASDASLARGASCAYRVSMQGCVVGHEPASLDELIDAICIDEGCARSALIGRSREPRLVRIRARIAAEATGLGLASMTEIARRFGRTPASVSWTLNRRSRGPPDAGDT